MVHPLTFLKLQKQLLPQIHTHFLQGKMLVLFGQFLPFSDTAGLQLIIHSLTVNSSPMAQQPPVSQGLPIIQSSRSHPGTQQSVGVLWTSDEPATETSTWHHTIHTRDRLPRPPTGFETPVPTNERSQTHALDLVATEIGKLKTYTSIILRISVLYCVTKCGYVWPCMLFSIGMKVYISD